ncbi:MAG: anhydro-N-acetylmuramic acid kinase [Thiotrichales bacterium]|nr:anhydro-N-acetylmuramic acid kinase [Thiotrichales bacterium]
MSGTSVDAIDSVLVHCTCAAPQLQTRHSTPIPAPLKQSLLACNTQKNLDLLTLAKLHAEMGKLFAQAVQELLECTDLKPSEIRAIGSHGQTIFHTPESGMSLQIGHPAIIAKLTGITTAGDFRIDDMALGGQGAPFAPVFHQALFAQQNQYTAVVNIGGLANLSLIPPQNSDAPILGWDTGPGNGLLDEIAQQRLNQSFDDNGSVAAQGKIHSALLKRLLADPYFARPAPKSSGRDYFNLAWLTAAEPPSLKTADLLATLTELTAQSIAQSLLNNPIQPQQLWVCGGGAYNDFLRQRLAHHLPKIQVASTAQAGHDPQALEAMLFAWLAQQRLTQQPVKLRSVTGAHRDAILGGVWLP